MQRAIACLSDRWACWSLPAQKNVRNAHAADAPEQVPALAPRSPQKLWRRNMPVGAQTLRPEATHLSHSDACLGDGGTRELCAQLVRHANLTSLDLRGCQIHAAGAAAIAALLLHQVRAAWAWAECTG